MDLMTRYRAMAGVKKGGGGLPAGYFQLSFLRKINVITSTGHIDTGIVCGNGYCAEIEFRLNSYSAWYESGIIGAGTVNQKGQGIAVRNQKLKFTVTQDDIWDIAPIALNTWYNVKFSTSQGNHFIYLDDVLVYSSTVTVDYSLTETIRLFAENNEMSMIGDIRKAVIYGQSSIPLTMPTTPIANFVFCQRESDNALGVYDLVSQSFIAKTGNSLISPLFTYGQNTNLNNLPTEYQEVEWIGSNGNQYIDTNFYPNQDTRAVIDCALFANNNPLCFGGRLYYYTRAFIFVNNYNNNFNNLFVNYAISFQTPASLINDTNKHVIDMNKNGCYIDNSLVCSFNSATFSVPNTFLLFAHSHGNAEVLGYSTYKLYSAQIYDNGTLVRNLIPCYRKADFEVGLYDKINNIFYTNAAS